MLKKFYLLLLIPFILNAKNINNDFSYLTLKGYAHFENENIFYNYFFDITHHLVYTGTSILGLTRHKKNPNKIDIIYGLNSIVGLLLLKRSFSIVHQEGLFNETYLEIQKYNNPLVKERIAEYRLSELSNSIRQLRKITSYFGITSALFIASFSQGKRAELASSGLILCNSIFYLLFYNSFGEDAYDKSFYFKKAYPEISLIDNNFKFVLNIKF